MSVLSADFQFQYSRGPTICAAFEVPAHEFSVTILFGPSGCGKTTILRCLAGLEQPQRGHIKCGSEIWFDSIEGRFVSPQRRGIGFLFQDYALFPHMTVAANVGYSISAISHMDRKQRVGEMLEFMGLAGLEKRMPHQLSGGEQQRVALARAVIRRPRVLLLDEPLSALDLSSREVLRRELRKLLKALGIPCFFVTHDRLEAMALGDRMFVLDRGAIIQSGALAEVFSRPNSALVANMVGVETVIPARLLRIENGLAIVSVGKAELLAVAPPQLSDDLFVCIRGEDVTLQYDPVNHTSARNRLNALVLSLTSEGSLTRVELDCGFRLVAVVTKTARDELGLCEGTQITAMIKAPAIHVIQRS